MNSIYHNIKTKFTSANSLHKIIYFNISIFLIISALNILSFLFMIDLNQYLNYFTLPASLSILIKKPWAIISYMFIHQSFLHLFFNMLWLYFGGKFFLKFFNNKQFTWAYILGGISGAFLFIIAFNVFPVFKIDLIDATAVGASASVLAIIIIIATRAPNYQIPMILLGSIKLKHIAIISIVLDVLSIPTENAGGHIAHIGGALFGYIYVKLLNEGIDLTKGMNNISNYIIGLRRKRPVTSHKRPKTDIEFIKMKKKNQARVDEILDKISKSGYDSLTQNEKEMLFNASKK